ncbi:MAG: vWA domain-containing protein [Acidobacteriaceae bacterium]
MNRFDVSISMRSALLLGLAACVIGAFGICSPMAIAQGTSTETIVTVKAKSKQIAPPVPQSAIEVKVGNKPVTLTGWSSVMAPGRGVQLVFLMDGQLRMAVGKELQDIINFFMQLPPSVEISVGYMEYGQVSILQGFTADHTLAGRAMQLPYGRGVMNGSPYFCLSELAKNWPSRDPSKMRAVFMVTDGVDRYNGAQNMDMDDPYVQTAIKDAQKAGISVSSMYYRDAGLVDLTQSATISGQGLLQQVSQATDGEAYYEGDRSPISMTPYLDRYKARLNNEYVATFMAPGAGLQPIKIESKVKGIKVTSADHVQVGNMLSRSDGK